MRGCDNARTWTLSRPPKRALAELTSHVGIYSCYPSGWCDKQGKVSSEKKCNLINHKNKPKSTRTKSLDDNLPTIAGDQSVVDHLATKFDKVFTRGALNLQTFDILRSSTPPPLHTISSRRLSYSVKITSTNRNHSRCCHFAWKSLLVHATNSCHWSRELRGNPC